MTALLRTEAADLPIWRPGGGRRRRFVGPSRRCAWPYRTERRRQDDVSELDIGSHPAKPAARFFSTAAVSERCGRARRAAAGIRRTFQNLRLFREMTAIENVMVGLHANTAARYSIR